MPPPPFPTAEAAWFWTASMLERRRSAALPPLPPAPCRPEDVLRCLDSLYRNRRIVLLHAHILRVYGRRGRAPSPNRPAERSDLRLWTEAMDGLDAKLRRAGIVAEPREDGVAEPRANNRAEPLSRAAE